MAKDVPMIVTTSHKWQRSLFDIGHMDKRQIIQTGYGLVRGVDPSQTLL